MDKSASLARHLVKKRNEQVGNRRVNSSKCNQHRYGYHYQALPVLFTRAAGAAAPKGKPGSSSNEDKTSQYGVRSESTETNQRGGNTTRQAGSYHRGGQSAAQAGYHSADGSLPNQS